jgi:hypothetical protein
MKKGVKIALIGIPLLAGAYLIYKQLRKPKAKTRTIPEKKEQIQEVKVEPKTTPTPINPSTTSDCNFPLKNGTYNCDKVRQLQILLNCWPYNFINYPLVEDGDFGAKTEGALSDVTAQIAQIKNPNQLDFPTAGKGHWVQIKNQQDLNNLIDSIEEELNKVDDNTSGIPYYIAQPTPTNTNTNIFFPTF